ncbi:MAG: hypothetical protein E1N59_2787 [Puniceicoccaceae bacterium 5H]|nr:MAG: hypothetical protein E1N59_2787 [Puniceicoccaceae bacterium 5H]
MYRLSREAESDLEQIWIYIALDNPEAADGVVDFLEAQLQRLSRNPQIGRPRLDICSDALCFAAGKPSWRSQFLISTVRNPTASLSHVSSRGIKIFRIRIFSSYPGTFASVAIVATGGIARRAQRTGYAMASLPLAQDG